MIGNFLRTTLRNLLRHKLQSLVSLVSLSLGLAVFGFAFLYVKQQLGYDSGWPDAERIHRLVVEQRGLPGSADGTFDTVNARAWPFINEHFANEIEDLARVYQYYVPEINDAQNRAGANLSFIDPALLDIFEFELVAGDLERVVSGPGFLALDEQTATRLGPDLALGKRVKFTGQWDDAVQEYEVAAIYRLPANRSQALNMTMLTLIHEYSYPLTGYNAQRPIGWDVSSRVWAKLKPGVSTEEFNALQPGFVEEVVTVFDEVLGPDRRVSDHLFYRWQPLREIYFNPIPNEAGFSGDMARVTTFAMVGVLVLLVACSNSISLSLASALERRKEIGIRKAAGALERDIVVQHLGESALLALLALVPAIVMLEALLPAFQALMPFRVALDAGPAEYAALTFIAACVGLANGIYPALILSAVRPQAVLKPGAAGGVKAGQTVRGILVGAQFCFASMLLIGTAALYVQLAVTRAQPLGFVPDNLAVVYLNTFGSTVNLDGLGNEIESIPGVVNATFIPIPPNTNMAVSTNSMSLFNKEQDSGEIKTQMVPASHELLPLVQVRLLAGRNFDPSRDMPSPAPPPEGQPAREQKTILNRTAARMLGFAEPGAAVDKIIYRRFLDSRNNNQFVDAPVRVIGVAEDNMYMSLRRRPGPEAYMPVNYFGSNQLIKFEPGKEEEVRAGVTRISQELLGVPPSGIMFVEQSIRSAFQVEQNESKLLLISAGLALLLACIGLYGLAAFSMERRTKEIGVRKVMGAELGSLLRLFLWRFSWPVVLANVVAWPVAGFFVLQWIERFPYQMEKAWLVPLCLAALLVILLIALLTVSVLTTRAASANPVRALRYE